MKSPVRKVVFPAAGLGTRFLPATKAQPKEMLPLVDKPIIQYGVEEAVASGVENIIIVTGRGKNAIEDHFDVNIELESFLAAARQAGPARGDPQDLQHDQRRLRAAGRAARPRPRGAVTADLVGDEPFAVILADDVIDADPPALKQMIDVFEKVGGPVLAVERVPPDRSRATASSTSTRRSISARASTWCATWSKSRRATKRRRTSPSSAATC